jgi:hypothetical protein
MHPVEENYQPIVQAVLPDGVLSLERILFQRKKPGVVSTGLIRRLKNSLKVVCENIISFTSSFSDL